MKKFVGLFVVGVVLLVLIVCNEEKVKIIEVIVLVDVGIVYLYIWIEYVFEGLLD